MSDPKIRYTNLVCVSYKANAFTTEYHFMGLTKEEADAKLQEFLNKKSPAPVEKIPDDILTRHPYAAPVVETVVDVPTPIPTWLEKKVTTRMPQSPNLTFSDTKQDQPLYGNTGKTWMISKEKHERVRVDADKVESYLAAGYIKGGPRTSID